MGERAERGRELFLQGYNCAQAVFLPFADMFDMDGETALRVSSAFGGGMGRMREVCGTVSGMALVCGMRNGTADPKDQKQKTANYAEMRALAERFREANGSIICRELLGIPAGTQEPAAPVPRTAEYYRKRPCPELVRNACEILEERYCKSEVSDLTSKD